MKTTQEIIAEHGHHDSDTGSPEVQVAETLDILTPQVVEHSPALSHQHQQPTAAVMVAFVDA